MVEISTCGKRGEGYGSLPDAYYNEYYRPNDVANAAQYIRDNSFGGHTFGKIVTWVKDNIEFKYDSDVWGINDYWQDPLLTMQIRSGDCEDSAFLVSSMLLALGYETYCVSGVLVKADGTPLFGHAWTEVKAENGIWYWLDATSGGGIWTLYEQSDETMAHYIPVVIPIPNITDCIRYGRNWVGEPQVEPNRLPTFIQNVRVIDWGGKKRIDGNLRYQGYQALIGLPGVPIELYDTIDTGETMLIATVTTMDTPFTGKFQYDYSPLVGGTHRINIIFRGTGEPTPMEMAVTVPSYDEVSEFI